jgi:hypothetical protein
MMPVSKHVQKRTCEQEKKRKQAEEMGPVFAEEHHQGDCQEAEKDKKSSRTPEASRRGRGSMLSLQIFVVVHVALHLSGIACVIFDAVRRSVKNHPRNVEPCIGMHNLARDGCRVVACEQHRHAANLTRIDRAPKRSFGCGFGDELVEVFDA